MYCTECGFKLLDGDQFCRNCGKKIGNVQPQQQPMSSQPNNVGAQPSQPTSNVASNVQRPQGVSQQPMGGQPNNVGVQPSQPTSNVASNVQRPQGVSQQPMGGQPNNVGVQPSQPTSNVASNVQRPQGVSQQPIDNRQYVAGQSFQQGNTSKAKVVKSNNSNLLVLIGVVAAFVILLGVACWYFISANSPANVYKAIIKNTINEIYSASQSSDKINRTITLGMDVNPIEDTEAQTVLDFINKTTIGINFQTDAQSKQLVLGIDSDYDNESLIDFKAFLDMKNNEAYVYFKDYYDKYIKVETNDDEGETNTFESLTSALGEHDSSVSKKVTKIVIEEATKIVDLGECSKKDGALVFKITEKQLTEGIKTILTNLKNNEEYLKCFKNPEDKKEALESIISGISEPETNETVEFAINKSFFSTKIEKAVITCGSQEIIIENVKDRFEYKANQENQLVLSGYFYIENDKKNDTDKLEMLIQIPEVGDVKINIDVLNKDGKEIDKVDKSKVKSINEITEEEQAQIIEKLQNSKLFELLATIGGAASNEPEYDFSDEEYSPDFTFGDYEDDEDESQSNIIDNTSVTNKGTDTLKITDTKTINIKIPEGFEPIYTTDDYKSYRKDYVTIRLSTTTAEKIEDCFNRVSSFAEYAKKDQSDYYKNVTLSDLKKINANGRTYYYQDFGYTGISNMIRKERYIYVDLNTKNKYNNNVFLCIEINMSGSEITDSLMNAALSAY